MKKRQTLIQKVLSPVAVLLNGIVGSGYNATDPRRKLLGNTYGANKASANTLLSSSGPVLRSHCRNLERNNPSARAGIEALNGLVVGTGIDLAPDTKDDVKNNLIRAAFYDWVMSCGVDGSDIYRLQAIAMREIATVGEAIWRVVPGEGKIPLRVLPLESEWLSDVAAMAPANGCTICSGVELDAYGQPVSYFIEPPEFGKPERVAARSIVHMFERRRPLQARGEPWLAPVIETLMNERDLVDAELYAAKQTAAMALVITSERHDTLDTDEDGDADDPAQAVRIGGVARLYPGEDIKSFGHTRPSQMIAPFRQMLRGDLAASLRIPIRLLSRDVGGATYMNIRADFIDTAMLLSPVREWVGHQSIGRLYHIAAPFLSAIVGFPVDPRKYRLLPDGQPYVDPVKDIRAAADAIDAKLSTHEAEISKRGGDYRQVWAQLSKEKSEAKAAGLTLDASATNAPAPDSTPGNVDDEKPEAEEPKDKKEDEAEDDAKSAERHRRAVEIARASAPVMPSPAPQTIVVRAEMPSQPTPVVHVEGSTVNVPPQVVNVGGATVNVPAPTVTVRESPAPVVNVSVPTQPAPVVHVAAPAVTVENHVEVPQRPVKVTPLPNGGAMMEPQ